MRFERLAALRVRKCLESFLEHGVQFLEAFVVGVLVVSRVARIQDAVAYMRQGRGRVHAEHRYGGEFYV